MIVKDRLYINSINRFQIVDITPYINEKIKKSQIYSGIINVFTKHTTSAIIINENEKGLQTDIFNILYDLIPDGNRYSHDMIDHNAGSHLRSLFLGPSETIPIYEGSLDLGRWQSVFFIELDGPRSRRQVDLTIMGD
ncbi:secondary thiamine-phosphate synthase enzyme YjbQ [uncultured Methanobrevibacter sp.]|uniref:secondary thiamine-phosphate synthase enzyme YjbQ n=1 Tax=uncultured Methanobrevibacter sp. TaxID=253161 RepID=UPI002583EFCD|nr:secondary thiamine-phosphate synthase enzyme YjbQ [uncultured Methanobrevibacter sp.]